MEFQFSQLSNILSLLLSALSHLRLLKPPPHDSDHHPSSAHNAVIVILDASSSSLLRVPLHVIMASIKNQVRVIPYSDSDHHVGGDTTACMVCLGGIDGCDAIRELVNCEHVFHRECLDGWVDVGHVNCPLCRSMLLPPKKLMSSITTATIVVSPAAGDSY